MKPKKPSMTTACDTNVSNELRNEEYKIHQLEAAKAEYTTTIGHLDVHLKEVDHYKETLLQEIDDYKYGVIEYVNEYRQHLGEVTEGLAEASRTMETLQECKRMQLAEYSGTSLPPAYLQKTGQKCDGGFILDLKPSSSVDACKQRCSQLSSCDMFHHKADEEVCIFYKESDSASCLADTGVDTYVRRR